MIASSKLLFMTEYRFLLSNNSIYININIIFGNDYINNKNIKSTE